MSVNKKFGLWPAVFAIMAIFALSAANISADSDIPNKNPVADVTYSGNAVSFLPKVDHSAITLSIDGPNGLVCKKTFSGGAAPFVNLGDYGPILDGQYNYELVVTPNEVKIRKEIQKAGIIKKPNLAELNNQSGPMIQSGSFRVINGMIINGMNMPEPQRLNDIQHQDDVIITFSLCVGNDCVNGESFGFDTFRLKENNLRIHFQDTSNSGSFPTNDWRIVINDSNNGGASYFAVEDSNAGRQPFRVDAGAPASSLYVDGQGDVGIGTSNPVADIHIANGNTPTLRLEQNGSSGFTPQTWDLSGNEANFFIRDATNGSELPLRIQPGAPSNSLYIANTGSVGFGTSSPNSAYDVHIYDPNSGAYIVAERGDGATMEFGSSGNFGIIGTRTDHLLKLRVGQATILELNKSGNYLQVYNSSGAALGNYDGTWNDSSSRDLKENIHGLTIDEAEAVLEDLEPVKYNYKHQKNEERLGFIAEDVPDLVANKNRKTLSNMDFIAVLTKVVKKQQKTIEKLNKRIENLEKKK